MDDKSAFNSRRSDVKNQKESKEPDKLMSQWHIRNQSHQSDLSQQTLLSHLENDK